MQQSARHLEGQAWHNPVLGPKSLLPVLQPAKEQVEWGVGVRARGGRQGGATPAHLLVEECWRDSITRSGLVLRAQCLDMSRGSALPLVVLELGSSPWVSCCQHCVPHSITQRGLLAPLVPPVQEAPTKGSHAGATGLGPAAVRCSALQPLLLCTGMGWHQRCALLPLHSIYKGYRYLCAFYSSCLTGSLQIQSFPGLGHTIQCSTAHHTAPAYRQIPEQNRRDGSG